MKKLLIIAQVLTISVLLILSNNVQGQTANNVYCTIDNNKPLAAGTSDDLNLLMYVTNNGNPITYLVQDYFKLSFISVPYGFVGGTLSVDGLINENNGLYRVQADILDRDRWARGTYIILYEVGIVGSKNSGLFTFSIP